MENDLIEKVEIISSPNAVIKVECLHLTDKGKDALTTNVRIPARGEEHLPIIQRAWAMPSASTFTIKPIRQLVKKYLNQSLVSVDPFARNCGWATFTNDLNPDTEAKYHLEAKEFLQELVDAGVKADLVLFDPPYSRRQVMEVYQGIGKDFQNKDSQYFSVNWRDERALINELLVTGGIVFSFGWHSNGMQQSGHYKIIELLTVAHGGAHNDTIVTVERKQPNDQISLFGAFT